MRGAGGQKAVPQKERAAPGIKGKQGKASTAAFLAEGSIEFFIVPKK